MEWIRFIRLGGWLFLLAIFTIPVSAQKEQKIDGSTYVQYKPSYFKPHRGIYYSLFAAPVVTIDPMGLGKKSTYGIGLGSRFTLWESKKETPALSGLSVVGFYTAVAYEYYPQQYDKVYASLWVRVKALIPLAARTDLIYGYGYGMKGVSARLCIGFEVKSVSVFVCGEYFKYYSFGSWHPNLESPYTNSGEIMVLIPFLTRKDK